MKLDALLEFLVNMVRVPHFLKPCFRKFDPDQRHKPLSKDRGRFRNIIRFAWKDVLLCKSLVGRILQKEN